ncbi:MAG: DUF362 domain-containing protein, partial [Candidatus Lokiarchaeota archaeon]|nr:DUF362 domain-containing protein [Candidatus Lokiarchaeota archaeon]
MRSTIGICKDGDPRAAARAALDLVRDDVVHAIDRWERSGGKKSILIKPNLLSTDKNLACNTSVESCLGIADFFKENITYTIFLGDGTTYESTHQASTMRALNNHGYTSHEDTWNLVDLHEGNSSRWFEIVN